MSTSFEKIKDANQLQDYLKQHAASGGTATGPLRTRDVSPAANEYMGMKQLKGSKAPAALQGRYEKKAAADGLEDEVRSVHAEIDYTKKDASRHIVTNQLTSDKLR